MGGFYPCSEAGVSILGAPGEVCVPILQSLGEKQILRGCVAPGRPNSWVGPGSELGPCRGSPVSCLFFPGRVKAFLTLCAMRTVTALLESLLWLEMD